MAESLPSFRYHPDPVASGAVVAEAITCACCGLARDHRYVGPAYCEEEIDPLCPWCIADGSAAMGHDAEFVDVDAAPAELPKGVANELSLRTPSFCGWQEERWLYCCGDAAAFIGPAGAETIAALPDAVESLRPQAGAADVHQEVARLRVDGSPRAYLFRCLHCGKHLAYADSR